MLVQANELEFIWRGALPVQRDRFRTGEQFLFDARPVGTTDAEPERASIVVTTHPSSIVPFFWPFRWPLSHEVVP